MTTLTCFKAYDIRGKLGKELNTEIAYRIGRAYGQYLKPKTVVLGGDVRLTSEELKLALADGLMDAGTDVIDIGTSGTEEIYFATSFLSLDGGIEVTASHNPLDYNGMKLVSRDSRPISGDTGLLEIKKLAENNLFFPVKAHEKGKYSKSSVIDSYVEHLLTYIDINNFNEKLKLVINSGNGTAGKVIDAIESQFKKANLPVEIIKVNHEADGNFPNGIPNPLLPECREDTSKAVIEHSADMGIAFDGDFDRCFLFDSNGNFVEGYYIVGLLADAFLSKNKGETIIHDPRLSWNTIDIVENLDGKAVMSKTGHAFIKDRMRSEDAIYGGEMSAHHYFRDFFYCDSGMIPWLLVAELLMTKKVSLESMISERIAMYPCSGEINYKVSDTSKVIANIKNSYLNCAIMDQTDGLSFEFAEWRFNVRTSNTEPLLRLNVESRQDVNLVREKVAELEAIILQA